MKFIYKPFALVVGLLAGILSNKILDRIWSSFTDEDLYDPDDRDATWGEVLISAAVSGVVIKVVQALIRRGGAVGFERATGFWPGDEPKD
jgi:hypothetical protein